jgi:hypothetical protein
MTSKESRKIQRVLKQYVTNVNVCQDKNGIYIEDYVNLGMIVKLQILNFLQTNRNLVNGLNGNGRFIMHK